MFRSIQTKLIALIFTVVLGTGVFILFFVVDNQKGNLISATDRTLYLNVQTLIVSLRNMMVSGEAPILMQSMKGLRELGEYKTIGIYRSNGDSAFSDYSTLRAVNAFQSNFFFKETERIAAMETEAEKTGMILKAVETFSPIKSINERLQQIEYFYPVENTAQCASCHGSENPVRGIVHISLSISGIFRQIDSTRNLLTIFFIGIIIFISVILALMLRGMVIRPVLNMRSAVKKVGNGDFTISLRTDGKDELGELARSINEMTRGLEERFKLTRYVSSSTIGVIKSGQGEQGDTHKKELTVFFSDIRGFTSYSETHEPEIVIKHLNMILEVQAEEIHKHKGDVDKFVGDEIMATFESPLAAVQCAFAIREQIRALDERIGQNLLVGMGINTGEVITGHIGSAQRQEYAAIGDTVNVAARLCASAAPLEILATQMVYKAVHSQVYGEVRKDQVFKGKAGKMDIYTLKEINLRQ